KRPLLTAPTPRVEVGESFAAARQSGSIMAHKVNYCFVDTVDASIQASEKRTMAAIEVVNLRVHYQAQVRRRESEERELRPIRLWLGLGPTIGQRQDADDRTTGYIIRIQALKAGARVDTL
ncbi:hypothetical protein Tco_0274483, partial [Tanacetum coccineum]